MDADGRFSLMTDSDFLILALPGSWKRWALFLTVDESYFFWC